MGDATTQLSSNGTGCSPARIGIVDDHGVTTVGVAALLDGAPDLTLAAHAPTVAELLVDAAELDLVILDLRLADGSSPAANVRQLQAHGALVLVYTSGEAPALIREAARAGVIGMVRKSERPHVLKDAIRQALAGQVVASTEWAAAVDSDPDLAAVRLTQREIEVLQLYASGEKAFRVGTLLGISRETVLDHIRRIRSKYAEANRPAHTKIDLYHRAVEDGVIDRSR